MGLDSINLGLKHTYIGRSEGQRIGNIALFFPNVEAKMGFANIWYSHPRKYGQGSRAW